MIIQCPDCHQDLEVNEQWVGREISCTACGQRILLTAPESPTPVHSPKDGGGFGKLLFVVLLLVAAALGIACYKFHESPQQVWQRIANFAQKQFQPAPAFTPPTPVPVAPPAPAPVVVQPPTPPPATNIVVIPTPPTPDPLTWILDHKEQAPQEVTLRADTVFSIVLNGHEEGSATLPAGNQAKFVQLDPEKKSVTVSIDNGTATVPISSTDLESRAKEAMVKADAEAKAAEEKKLAAADAPTPFPAAETSETVETTDPMTAAASSTNLEQIVDAPSDLTANTTETKPGAFVHPGLLHNEEDFLRMKKNLNREPWKSGWQRLISNRHASLDWKPRPIEVVVRGKTNLPQNYALLFNDVAAAYACALRWRVSDDSRYADKAVEIMNAWSSTLTKITGSTDADLAAGIYGYEFANAAEIMRSYKGWKPEDFARFKKMMIDVFYSINHDFLIRHNGTKIDHYWCNWDACNMASILTIGVLCDRRDIYREAVNYYKHGRGNGAIAHAVYYIHPNGLGQWQESGRDQGHTTLGIGLLGAFCEMAWKQGDDLYGYDHNRFLAGCEYVAKYNLGENVPFKRFSDSLATHETISSGGRGGLRPVWELVYNHYVKRKGLSAPYVTKAADAVRPEGGGGDYGPNSGGYDQLGYGTLTATLP